LRSGRAACKPHHHTIIAVFLGDELLAQGVTVAELMLAAEAVKAARGGLPGRAIVYWNEA
jgi:hypothetical protein